MGGSGLVNKVIDPKGEVKALQSGSCILLMVF